MPGHPPPTTVQVFSCKDWVIDLNQRELRLAGSVVPVGGRAFDILEALVRSAGRPLSRSELIGCVWAGQVVAPGVLKVQVFALRKAFGADRGLIQTVGSGYCLTGDWQAGDWQAGAAPAVPDMRQHPPNLPLVTSWLVGRGDAMAACRSLMLDHRALTLIGPGGIGKTSLAVELARQTTGDVPSDAWLVELAPLADPRLVPSAVANVLGLRIEPEGISPESVAGAIGQRNLLLVLDNCEHVIDAVADLAEAIVRHCPGVSVLATSREPLRIDGEAVYDVPPLEVPSQTEIDPESILHCSAVQLLLHKARLRGPSPPVDAHGLRLVAALCRRLDGIPLAIELAATRVATLGLDEVLGHLDARFDLLTSGKRSALPRQRTLRATFEWSYDLLGEPERRLFRIVSVFAGSFTIDAVLALAGDDFNAASSLVEGVAGLVGKSLVRLAGSGAPSRWYLLETIRSFGLEKLREAGEWPVFARLHASYYRDLVAPASSQSAFATFADRMEFYRREIDNVRAALDWAFSPTGDTQIAVDLTISFGPVWLYLGLNAECGRYVEAALDRLHPHSQQNSALSLQLRLAFAVLYSLGSVNRAEPLVKRALEIAETLRDLDSHLLAIWAAFSLHSIRGDQKVAMSDARQFCQLARKSSSRADVLVGVRLIGTTLHYRGDQTRARRCHDHMLRRYVLPTDARNPIWIHHDPRGTARTMLSRVLWMQGDIEQAQREAQASVALAESSGQEMSVRYPLSWAVVPISLGVGDIDQAEAALTRLLRLRQGGSENFWTAAARCLEGSFLVYRGQCAAGVSELRRGLQSCVQTGWTMYHSAFLAVYAEGLSGLGQHAAADAALDRALAWSEQTGEQWYDAELHRLKGEVALASGQRSIPIAERCFNTALAVSRRQGALFWELRAATSLARLLAEQARDAPAQAVLDPVFARIKEGFGSRDVASARRLLGSV
jgi:predicted ATPase/DNA-binding winged helix-turn-helix (wHTH) protein